jgi:hypothetical protein
MRKGNFRSKQLPSKFWEEKEWENIFVVQISNSCQSSQGDNKNPKGYQNSVQCVISNNSYSEEFASIVSIV